MADYMEAASAVLAAAQRRVETAAQNVTNMNTPGYRRRVSFEQALGTAGAPQFVTTNDFTPGKPKNTDNPFDLAISGSGFFTVHNEAGQPLYTRDGQFHRDADNRVVTQGGLPLQLENGGDLVVKSGQFQVSADGTVTDEGEALGKLALASFSSPQDAEPADGGLFSSRSGDVAEAKGASVNQGMLESSNVSLGDEMTAVMQSLRAAESGQRLMNVYDDLLGRAISTFGQQ